MKKELLEKAIKEKTLIGIRTNQEEWDETIIGFVTDIQESFFTINEIDKYGSFIGFTQFDIDDIINIDINDRYQTRLLYILNHNSEFDANKRLTIWKEGERLLTDISSFVDKKEIVTLYFDEDNYIVGIILKCDTTYVMIKGITTDGDEDGISCYPISRLIGLRSNSLFEQKIKILYDNKHLF